MAGPRLATARSAARVFLGELRPRTRRPSWRLAREVETVAPLSTDRAAQYAALARLDAFGTTGLYDAVVRAIELTQAAKGRRALVLFSDGNDRYSRTTAERRSSRRAVPTSWCIRSLSAASPSPFFERLAALTGGRRVLRAAIRRLARDAAARGARAALSVSARLRAGCTGTLERGSGADHGPCQAARRDGPSSRRVLASRCSLQPSACSPQLVAITPTQPPSTARASAAARVSRAGGAAARDMSAGPRPGPP